MLIKRLQSTIDLFDELGMGDLSELLSQVTPDNFLIIAGVIEMYLGIDLLDPTVTEKLSSEQKDSIKVEWIKRKTKIQDLIFQKVGESIEGESYTNHMYLNFFTKITSFLLAFSCVYVFAVTFVPIPEGSQRLADTALGFVIGSIMSPIIGYLYTSQIKPSTSQKPPAAPIKKR